MTTTTQTTFEVEAPNTAPAARPNCLVSLDGERLPAELLAATGYLGCRVRFETGNELTVGVRQIKMIDDRND